MKAQNQNELCAYKNLKAEIQNFKTAKNAKAYDEAAEISLITKYCNKLSVSVDQFQKAHRQDLAQEYMVERDILRKLLPEPVNESQIRSELYIWAGSNKLIEMYLTEKGVYQFDAIETSKPFIPKKEMGNVIKHLKSKFPQADGKMISNIVKEYLV
jgi:uncharacterized protein YqeY